MNTEKFWAKVDKTNDCWLWKGAVDLRGYGRTNIGTHGKTALAHRAAWQLLRGDIPAGMYVCHHCDNPPCVRPEHLFLGTHQDNMRDALAKGRLKSGPHPKKLTPALVLHIRKRHAAGYKPAEIARELNVSWPTVGQVVKGRAWAHIA